jgi:hypothetical protein
MASLRRMGWIPNDAIKGLYEMSNAKAVSVGWRTRPFGDSAMDRLAPCGVRAGGRFDFNDTLSVEKEAEVIRAWELRSGKAAS